MLFIGSTLVIFYSKDEPYSIFGGMAAPEWYSPYEGDHSSDPSD